MKEGIQHEGEEGEPAESCYGLRQSHVVSGQSAEARGPSKRAFGHPPARQEHESALGLFELYYNQSDPFACCRCRRFLSRIPQIDKGHLDMRAGRPLNIRSKIGHLGSLLFIGRSGFNGARMATCVNRSMNFRPFFALVAISGSLNIRSTLITPVWCSPLWRPGAPCRSMTT